jgi:hypothetical protein
LQPLAALVCALATGCVLGGCTRTLTRTVTTPAQTVTVTVSDAGTTDTSGSGADTYAGVRTSKPGNYPDAADAGHTEVRAIGQSATVDGWTFRVSDIGTAHIIPPADEFSSALRPRRGTKLVTAHVAFTNDGNSPAQPFCGGRGAKLVDARQRQFELYENLYQLKGNAAICGADIQPGLGETALLVFEVPANVVPTALLLTNSDDFSNTSTAAFLPKGGYVTGLKPGQ